MNDPVEALAKVIYEKSDDFNEEGVDFENHHGSATREARRQARAALDWMRQQAPQ